MRKLAGASVLVATCFILGLISNPYLLSQPMQNMKCDKNMIQPCLGCVEHTRVNENKMIETWYCMSLPGPQYHVCSGAATKICPQFTFWCPGNKFTDAFCTLAAVDNNGNQLTCSNGEDGCNPPE